MATQQGQISIAAGEDADEVLTMYDNTGSTTVNINGWSLTLTATYPGGATVVTKSSPTEISVASPLSCQATIHFLAADTVDLPPGYYDFQIRRTDSGTVGEVTAGTLMLTD